MRQNFYIQACFILPPMLWLLSAISGCTVGQNYRPPDVTAVMQEEWQADDGASGQFAGQQPLTAWWLQFKDGQLCRLIDQLFVSSLALREARQRVIEAGARQGVVGADKQLQLAAALGYTHAETGEETVSLQGIPPGKTVDVFSAGVVAGWEIDLWGRTARLLEASEEDVRSGYADYHGMMVSLAAELTLTYVEARTLEARLATIRKNIALQSRTLELAQNRFQAGNGTALTMVHTERLLESTRSRLPELERALAAARNRINVLLGKPPQYQALQPGPMPAVPALIGIGLPVELLTRRPDIRQAFHRFHAAVARIGAAEAERYPALSLSGTLTLSSDSVTGMLDRDGLMYSLGPGIHFPILNGGRIDSTIAVRTSQAEQAQLALEQKIVAALAEVETAADGIVRSRQQVASLEAAAKLAVQSVEMADSLYNAGLGDFFQVLDNEQQLVILEESVLLARQQAVSEVVRLYRALGGGWQQALPVTAAGDRRITE